MKKLRITNLMALASLLVFGFAGISYLVLLLVDKDLAQLIAVAILGTLVPVYKYLREKQIRQVLLDTNPTKTSDLNKYTLQWYLVIIYGSVFLLGGFQLGAFLLGMQNGALVSILSNQPQILSVRLSDNDYKTLVDLSQYLTMLLTTLLIRPSVTFLVGRWVGKKGGKYAIYSVIAIVILASTISLLSIVLSPESFVAYRSNNTKGAIVAGTIRLEIINIMIGIPFGLLGYWRGRRKMLNGYVQDLFKLVARERKPMIVHILYQELEKTMGGVETGFSIDATEKSLDHQGQSAATVND